MLAFFSFLVRGGERGQRTEKFLCDPMSGVFRFLQMMTGSGSLFVFLERWRLFFVCVSCWDASRLPW